VRVYEAQEADNDSRGAWNLRQLKRSAHVEGCRWFHVFTGHLSHQIEHHLFPDLPAARYPELAPRVREICERYGQAYNTGSFGAQLGTVIQRIFTFSLPSLSADGA
jgi:linoleoyl-CoA desaturase